MLFFPVMLRNLWNFILDTTNEEIPFEVQKWLERKPSKREYDPSNHWKLWRQDMTEDDFLATIEDQCGLNMKQLGYFKLHNISRVKQYEQYPSVTDSCLKLPCL